MHPDIFAIENMKASHQKCKADEQRSFYIAKLKME
jgi:hypothetical protein